MGGEKLEGTEHDENTKPDGFSILQRLQDISQYLQDFFRLNQTPPLLPVEVDQGPYRTMKTQYDHLSEVPAHLLNSLGMAFERLEQEVFLVEDFQDDEMSPHNGVLGQLFLVAENHGLERHYGFPRIPSRFLTGYEVEGLIAVFSPLMLKQMGLDPSRFFVQMVAPVHYQAFAIQRNWSNDRHHWTLMNGGDVGYTDLIMACDGEKFYQRKVCHFSSRIRHSLRCCETHIPGLVRLMIRERLKA